MVVSGDYKSDICTLTVELIDEKCLDNKELMSELAVLTSWTLLSNLVSLVLLLTLATAICWRKL